MLSGPHGSDCALLVIKHWTCSWELCLTLRDLVCVSPEVTTVHSVGLILLCLFMYIHVLTLPPCVP